MSCCHYFVGENQVLEGNQAWERSQLIPVVAAVVDVGAAGDVIDAAAMAIPHFGVVAGVVAAGTALGCVVACAMMPVVVVVVVAAVRGTGSLGGVPVVGMTAVGAAGASPSLTLLERFFHHR